MKSAGRLPKEESDVVFGVEARDGVFICTVLEGTGLVHEMRIFPDSERGLRAFTVFAKRLRCFRPHLVVGYLDERRDRESGAHELLGGLQRLGFDVRPVKGGGLVRHALCRSGRPVVGARRSLLAAQSVTRNRHRDDIDPQVKPGAAEHDVNIGPRS